MCFLTWRTENTYTHTHTHSGYLEGHFFSWSSVHADPADCCNLHCKVMGWGLCVYFCGVVCVISCCLFASSCVCVCFPETGWAGRQLALGVLLLYKQDLVSLLVCVCTCLFIYFTSVLSYCLWLFNIYNTTRLHLVYRIWVIQIVWWNVHVCHCS